MSPSNAKDIAAGAVLICAIVVGCLTFRPYLFG
jgi:diacylglycerol kinase